MTTVATPTRERVAQPAERAPERDQRTSVLPPALAASAASESRRTYVVESLDGPNRLRELAGPWQNLADDAVAPNVFYEPAPLLGALAHLPAATAGRWRVLAVHAAYTVAGQARRQLCGLLPLVESRQRVGPTVWRPWTHPYCFLHAPLLRRGHAVPAWGTLLDWFGGRSLGVWSLLPADGMMQHTLVAGWQGGRPAPWIRDRHVRAVLRPDGGDADGMIRDALSGKRLREYRRHENALNRLGRLEYRSLQPNEDCRPWVERFLAVESGGWKGRSGTALASTAGDRSFFAAVCERLHASGRLRLTELRIDGAAVAVQCQWHARGGGFAFKIGYDETHARHQPGVLLQLDATRRFFDEPDLPWLDSCADRDHPMIDRLWPGRRALQSLVVPLAGIDQTLCATTGPLLRVASAALRRGRRLFRTGADR